MLHLLTGKAARSTFRHLILASTVAFVPVLLISAMLLYLYAETEQRRVEAEAETHLRSILSNVETEVNSQQSTSYAVAHSPSVYDRDVQELRTWTEILRDRFGFNVVVSLEDGTQILNLAAHKPLPSSAASREFNRYVLSRIDETTISDLVIGTNTGASLVVAATPSRCGVDSCVIRVSMPVKRFARILEREQLPPGWTVAIIGSDGRVIAQAPDSQESGKTLESRAGEKIDSRGRPRKGTIKTRSGDTEMVSKFENVAGTGWYVVVDVPRSLLVAPIHKSLLVLMTQMTAIVLAGFAVSNVISGRIVESLNELENLSAAIRRNSPNIAPLYTPVTEVNDVSLTLVASAQALQESLSRVRVLTREAIHRAKNQLTVISALAKHTARVSESLDDFQAKFDLRLMGLSNTQSLLMEEDWRGVKIRKLIQSQLSHYADFIGTRIKLAGPRMTLLPDAAQSMGLAIHELSSNSTKYGALSSTSGTVTISWGITGGKFVIEWIEEGGPPVATPKRKGFGTVIMTRLVSNAFDGQVTLEYEPRGIRWRLVGSSAYVSVTQKNGSKEE